LVEKTGESDDGGRIGTTGRGIGPAYADKMNRIGIRMADLLHPEIWPGLVRRNVRAKNALFQKSTGSSGLNEEDILNRVGEFADLARPMIIDTTGMMHREMDKGSRVLIEGAQGALLDIDFGTYPFVTSSSTIIGGAATGLGIDPRRIDRVVGVCKAYTTRVGNGPFPSEIIGGLGDELRRIGGEFGATTGRPRRCGWFDALVVRHAVRTSGVDALAITKLDVLDSFKEIKICTGYKVGNRILDEFPADVHLLDKLEPVEESMPGWNCSIQSCLKYGDLPAAARKYLDRLQELAGVPIGIVSVGSGREETIWL
jgi:adenylosuccinate synthase